MKMKMKNKSYRYNINGPKILGRVFGAKQRNPVKVNWNKRVLSLLQVFSLLLPKFNFWKGNWALGYVSTHI